MCTLSISADPQEPVLWTVVSHHVGLGTESSVRISALKCWAISLVLHIHRFS